MDENQIVLNSDLKSPGFVPFGPNLTQFVAKSAITLSPQVITEEDRHKADQQMYQEVLHYAGYTALIVLVVLLTVLCAATDPRSFVIAFGTGSPCCLLSPCVRRLYRYTNTKQILQVSGMGVYDPPENCHLTVKKLPKT